MKQTTLTGGVRVEYAMVGNVIFVTKLAAKVTANLIRHHIARVEGLKSGDLCILKAIAF